MKSLTNKMFVSTLLVFSIIVIGFSFALFAYFNWFYEAHEIDKIKSDLDQFAEAYANQNWDDQTLYKSVATFMQTHNATLLIYDDQNVFNFDSGTDSVAAIALTTSNVPSSDTITAAKTYPLATVVGSTTSIDGVLVSFPAIDTLNTDAYLVNSATNIQIGNLPYTGYKEVSIHREIKLNDGSTKYLYTSASLQSVDEMLKLLSTLIPIIAVLVLIMSLFLALIYSRMISKPIVLITNHANAMAGMDFDKPIMVKGRDELSVLANSLNTLSSELKNALGSLSVSNQMLQNEYDKEIKQEASRKAFVANVSHELRSPLGVIKSYAEGICDQIKIDKQQKYAQTIIDEVNLMDTLIHDMLEISKHDAGAITFKPTHISLSNLLHKSLFVLQSDLTEKGLQVVIDLPYDEIEADEMSLQRVIDNLVENAVKYSPRNSNIIIKTSLLENELATDQSIKFSIENECTPFSDEELDRIWDRFYKRDLSHHRKEKGTGLGLSIVKLILEGNGIAFGVERTDKGVEFYFVVPREKS